MKKLTPLFVIWSMFPLFVFGHGLGQSLEQPVGDYIANLEYNRLELSAGEPVTFGLNLLGKSREPVDFSRVLFEIYSGEEVLLSVFTSKPEYGETSLDYLFSEGGRYKVEVKFVENDKGLAEAVFDLDVAAKEGMAWYKNNLLIGLLGGFILGALLSFFSRRK